MQNLSIVTRVINHKSKFWVAFLWSSDKQKRIQNSGDGGEISHWRAPWWSGTTPKNNNNNNRCSPTLLSKGPSQASVGHFWSWDGPSEAKICPCRPHMEHLKHVNYLFSVNVNSKSLQYLIVLSKMGIQDRRGGEISPLPPPGCATAGKRLSR